MWIDFLENRPSPQKRKTDIDERRHKISFMILHLDLNTKGGHGCVLAKSKIWI